MIKINTKPIPKERPRFNRSTGRTYTPNTTKDFEEHIAYEYLNQGGEYFDSKPIKLKLTFGFEVPKSYSKKKREEALRGISTPSKCDIDNLVKCVQDGLNKVAYSDDRYIHTIEATKKFDVENYIIIDIF